VNRAYSHRSTVDKLGVKQGHAVAVVGALDDALVADIEARCGRTIARAEAPYDVVLIAVDSATDAAAVLAEWRRHIRPNGGIWLFTPKRQQRGYVNQNELIPAGAAAGLVDNKTCSVSETTSGMRFVIRVADR
jgi:Protein of unknown function (DUF3052)